VTYPFPHCTRYRTSLPAKQPPEGFIQKGSLKTAASTSLRLIILQNAICNKNPSQFLARIVSPSAKKGFPSGSKK